MKLREKNGGKGEDWGLGKGCYGWGKMRIWGLGSNGRGGNEGRRGEGN